MKKSTIMAATATPTTTSTVNKNSATQPDMLGRVSRCNMSTISQLSILLTVPTDTIQAICTNTSHTRCFPSNITHGTCHSTIMVVISSTWVTQQILACRATANGTAASNSFATDAGLVVPAKSSIVRSIRDAKRRLPLL